MTLEYVHLPPGQPLPQLAARPFRAVLIAEQAVGRAWRDEVTAWLIGSGCLYFIAWGVACEDWHDAADWTVLEAHGFGEIPNDRFVMTTWHDKEPLSEAFWFAGNCASHPDIDLADTVIAHISSNERRSMMLQLYRDSQDAAGEA